MPQISVPAAKQPAMDIYRDVRVYVDEKPPAYHHHAPDHDHDHDAQWSLRERPHAAHNHCSCHNSRLRRIIFPALVAIVSLSGLVALFCVFGMGEGAADPGALIEGLFHVKRALDGNGGSNSGSESAFTKHKLYLIVVFVGLFVVVILGIMLAAWCCRESFENPLCCPCYLCACCGGMACLECLACGLCVEGAEQM